MKKERPFETKKFISSLGSPIVHQGNIDEILRICREYHSFKQRCSERNISCDDDFWEIANIYPCKTKESKTYTRSAMETDVIIFTEQEIEMLEFLYVLNKP